MDEVCILGRTGDDHLFKQFAARYDVPAYVRRARRVQEAFEQILDRCRTQREEWLVMVRAYAKAALEAAGESADGPLRNLATLLELVTPAHACGSERRLRRALRELSESAARFNSRWLRYLHEVDLSHVNQLRADYNRYYVLEKECALRSARLARLGFQPLQPVTVDELHAFMPPLPVPSSGVDGP